MVDSHKPQADPRPPSHDEDLTLCTESSPTLEYVMIFKPPYSNYNVIQYTVINIQSISTHTNTLVVGLDCCFCLYTSTNGAAIAIARGKSLHRV